jgi:hypothetical protein
VTVVVHAGNILLFEYADKGILGKFVTNRLYLLGRERMPIIGPRPYATSHGRATVTDAFSCAASATAFLAGAFAHAVRASAKATFPWTFASAPTTFVPHDHGGRRLPSCTSCTPNRKPHTDQVPSPLPLVMPRPLPPSSEVPPFL